ncbi:MAG: purine-nucleoside phosphorylase [Polyangia bacterium]
MSHPIHPASPTPHPTSLASATASTFTAVDETAARIRAFLPPGARPRVALVLGSGLGAYAEQLEGATCAEYGALGLPRSGVHGHAGRLFYGRSRAPQGDGAGRGVEILAMQGRVHAYEGHDLSTVVLPVRALIRAGCEIVLLTNAAGGLGEGLVPGDLVLIRDHLNLLGSSPLRGENDERFGPRFPDMTQVYDPALRAIAERTAARLGMRLPSGVYAAGLGPQYETPAEVRMLKGLGADLVGMSTVPEAIAARHMGARVLGISCVTNLAAGISPVPLSHDEVTETAARVRADFIRLLDGILGELGATLGA